MGTYTQGLSQGIKISPQARQKLEKLANKKGINLKDMATIIILDYKE